MKCYIDLWRRIFDYKGKSSLKEFWIPFAVNAAAAAVGAILAIFCGTVGWIIGLVMIGYVAVSSVPFVALTVRRLHDTGRSGWWYFLVFGAGIGAVVLAIMLAGGSSVFNPFGNANVCVYGPPPGFDELYNPSENFTVGLYGVPEDPGVVFVPDDNLNEDVYGPPIEDFAPSEESPESEESHADSQPAESSTDSSATETKPDSTTVPPAEDEKPAQTESDIRGEVGIIGNDEEVELPFVPYNPPDNIEEAVYGPPEWFE